MEILLRIKKSPPILPDYQYLVNSCQQLQLIYFLILNQKITFYQDILDLFPSNDLNHIRQIFILATFGFNIITLTYFIIKALLFSQNSSKFEKNYFQFFRIKPQLLFVIIINVNVGQLFYWNRSLLLTVGAIFNIGFALGQVAACQLVNVSYRFVEKNGICRRNASILPWIMLVVILVLIRFDNFMYTALATILRALLIIITNFRSSQAQSTSYIQYLFAFLQLSLTLFLLFSNTVLNNPLLCTFIFLLCFYSSHCLSSSLKLTLPKYYINNSHELLVSSSQEMEIEQDFGQNDEIVQRTLRVVRLWIDVYKLREVCINEEKWRHSHNQGKGYDLWWLQFNRAIIFHRVNCSNPTCKCQSINRTNPQLQPTINQLFIQLLKAKISTLQNISLVKNYFLIQILNKPFQAYYQLTKLHNKNVNDKKLLRKKELLELKMMVEQVRQMLSGILLKQRVANHQLNIEPIVEFQTHLKNMKNNLTYLTNHYCKFYTLFTKTLIPFSQIKALTSSLNKIKSQFNTQVSSYIDKFFHNVQFISICLLYEKYFDQYSQKISNRKEKLQIFNFSHRQSDQQIITDPQYGVVQIDLVNQVGKIIGFTKNIAKLLGYAIHDVTGQKVNKLMPHMFAKHHDKFLKNFVQRGSIKNLKIKQMAFYSRNSSKFIVPVTARIKVSYNIDGSFSALALIRKTPTKSDFILVSNSGKIQEMSQHLYDKLFRKLFNSDTFKLRRLCIYKMILALNHFINSEKQEHDEKIYQGTFMISNDENNMFKWFKPVDGQRNFEKNDKLESAFNTIMSKSSFTSFRSSNGTSATLTQESQDIAKKVSDLKESFKEYFQLIDLDQIRAFRIRFKFEDLVTAQFRCKVLEVVQICEELPQNLISLQLSKQLSEIGQLYGLQLSQTQKFRKYKHKSLENLQMPSTQQKQLKSETCSQHSSLNLSVYQNARTQKFENKNDIIGQGSVTSSLNSQSQKNQKKQAIISSFEQKNSISDTFYKALSLIQILTTLTLIIICFFSIRLQSDYVELQQDNLIISNFKVNFEFRLAVQQMYHFYHPFDLQPPQFLVSKKHILTDSMKLQLQNSIKWISDKLSYQLYFKEMTIVWADSGFQEKRNVLSVLGMIYSMFLMTQQLGQHLSDNYPLLIENLNALAQKEEEIVHMQSQNFQNKIHAVIAFYIAFLIILICIFIYINYKTVQTQTKIVDFLPFININSIHKKLQFYQKVSDHLKQAQQVIFQQIDQIPLTINNIAQQQRISSPKSPTAPKSLSKLPLKLVGNLSDSAPATTNNPRFLRIIRDHQTYFTFKNVMFGFVLIVVFGLVVWETEYFFYEGHHKFQAYLDLKQSAMIVQNIPSRLILLYFINTDKILHQQDIVIFPEDLYEIAHDKKFDLRYHLSRTDINGTELAQSLNYHFNTQICQLIECQNPSHIVQQEDIYYLAYRFNDAFEYLRKVNKTLPLSNSPKEELMRWLQEGNILEVFKGVQHILQLMKINQHEISNLFTQQINRIGYILLFFSLTLIPLLIFVMLFVKNKFIKYANGRLQDAQHIFKQFSWDILSENMYAINYFETKLKKAVKG